MTTTETRTTVTSLAPSAIRALRLAAETAADHGRNYIGIEDLMSALITKSPLLNIKWQMAHAGQMTFDELAAFVDSLIPGPSKGEATPSVAASVAFEITGPDADELTAMVTENRS